MTEAHQRVGRWLRNKWHLDHLIAVGGMAAVYAATHRNGNRAAIKLLHALFLRNEQARRRFLREGYAANSVGHRNAVLVLDDDVTEEGDVFLVMELLDGESFEQRIERVGTLSPIEVLEMTDSLLEVLACAHSKGILHRDIKPANIYLCRDGSVKLLDFGLARVRELSAEALDQSDGIVFGTVSYIAPEQARADNENLDARSDLWSIAATMFRALAGETVHPAIGPVIERLMAVARKPPRSLATVRPDLPMPLIELVDRALAFDPGDRWPSANVMRVVVQDVLAQLREEAGLPEPEVARPAKPQTIAPAGFESRPKTDPQAASQRPRGLPEQPARPTPSPSPVPTIDRRFANAKITDSGNFELEVGLDEDALREKALTGGRQAGPEPRRARTRTLLTKEGRAELRKILEERRASLGIPTPKQDGVPATTDLDIAVDDPGDSAQTTILPAKAVREAEADAADTTILPARALREAAAAAAEPDVEAEIEADDELDAEELEPEDTVEAEVEPDDEADVDVDTDIDVDDDLDGHEETVRAGYPEPVPTGMSQGPARSTGSFAAVGAPVEQVAQRTGPEGEARATGSFAAVGAPVEQVAQRTGPERQARTTGSFAAVGAPVEQVVPRTGPERQARTTGSFAAVGAPGAKVPPGTGPEVQASPVVQGPPSPVRAPAEVARPVGQPASAKTPPTGFPVQSAAKTPPTGFPAQSAGPPTSAKTPPTGFPAQSAAKTPPTGFPAQSLGKTPPTGLPAVQLPTSVKTPPGGLPTAPPGGLPTAPPGGLPTAPPGGLPTGGMPAKTPPAAGLMFKPPSRSAETVISVRPTASFLDSLPTKPARAGDAPTKPADGEARAASGPVPAASSAGPKIASGPVPAASSAPPSPTGERWNPPVRPQSGPVRASAAAAAPAPADGRASDGSEGVDPAADTPTIALKRPTSGATVAAKSAEAASAGRPASVSGAPASSGMSPGTARGARPEATGRSSLPASGAMSGKSAAEPAKSAAAEPATGAAKGPARGSGVMSAKPAAEAAKGPASEVMSEKPDAEGAKGPASGVMSETPAAEAAKEPASGIMSERPAAQPAAKGPGAAPAAASKQGSATTAGASARPASTASGSRAMSGKSAGASAKSVKSEPAQPAKSEPAPTQPAKAEPAPTQPAKAEPAPVKAEPAPAKAEPAAPVLAATPQPEPTPAPAPAPPRSTHSLWNVPLPGGPLPGGLQPRSPLKPATPEKSEPPLPAQKAEPDASKPSATSQPATAAKPGPGKLDPTRKKP